MSLIEFCATNFQLNCQLFSKQNRKHLALTENRGENTFEYFGFTVKSLESYIFVFSNLSFMTVQK